MIVRKVVEAIKTAVAAPKGQVRELWGMNRTQRRRFYKLNHKRLGWTDWDSVNGSK